MNKTKKCSRFKVDEGKERYQVMSVAGFVVLQSTFREDEHAVFPNVFVSAKDLQFSL